MLTIAVKSGKARGWRPMEADFAACPRALIAVTFVTLLPYDYGFIRLSPGL